MKLSYNLPDIMIEPSYYEGNDKGQLKMGKPKPHLKGQLKETAGLPPPEDSSPVPAFS